jgi:hypothetical protein
MKIKLIMIILLASTLCSAMTGFAATGPAGFNWIITWLPNIEEDLAGYKIYINGDPIIVTKADTSYRLLNVQKTKSICITAYDETGNESAFSDTVWIIISQDTNTVVIEPIVPDTTAPCAPAICEPTMEPLVWSAIDLTLYAGTGTFSSNPETGFQRLGVWKNDILTIPDVNLGPGKYRISYFANGKNGSPVIDVDGVKTSIIRCEASPSLYYIEINLSASVDLRFTVTGGDMWVFGQEAISITLIK